MQKVAEFNFEQHPHLKDAIISFSKEVTYASILQSNNYEDAYGKYEFMAAIGAERVLGSNKDSFEQLISFYQEKDSWLFGHFSYDLKNQIEKLESQNRGNFDFDELCFFEPQYLFLQKRGQKKITVHLSASASSEKLNELVAASKARLSLNSDKLSAFTARQSKEEYIDSILELKKHIQFGDIYEINYCTEFYNESVEIDPITLYKKLNVISPMPFSAFYKSRQDYLLCASPERFVRKVGRKIVSQPIKGTVKRGSEPKDDLLRKHELRNDLKEQTENVMIVDLVRNDLSKTAEKSSVKVEELFGVYTFPQVHQLISTVSSFLKEDVHFVDAVKSAFPMGSMTGAPKIEAMKIADRLEKSKRELYSGSVGYIDPQGDFDFNVVIRSLTYNMDRQFLSFLVGGAITNLSDPEKEYEECLLKAKAIFEL